MKCINEMLNMGVYRKNIWKKYSNKLVTINQLLHSTCHFFPWSFTKHLRKIFFSLKISLIASLKTAKSLRYSWTFTERERYENEESQMYYGVITFVLRDHYKIVCYRKQGKHKNITNELVLTLAVCHLFLCSARFVEQQILLQR